MLLLSMHCEGFMGRYCRERHVPMVLLEKDVDVNSQSGYCSSPSQAVATSGNEVVVRLLLNNGGDANTFGGFYGSGLGAAVSEGYIVQLLLENGVDVSVLGKFFRNPLE